MLTNREIEAAYARMRDRIDLVNAEYLKAVARQINAIGGLNASSIRKLAQMRIYRANVVKIKAALAKALNLSVQELQELLERAAREVYADADYMAVIRGRRLMQLEYNEPLKKYISAVSAQTEERFHNYSNTTCIDENYQEAVTNAIDAVARGVTDYRSAIRDTMRKLGGDGLRITYESGVTRRMDTALRQNVLDGVKQIQQEAQRLIGEEIGATGVELSAHPFSAVDHEPAQGRQFSLQEFSRMQAGQPFTDANGNRYDGFKRPIGEWNCRHFASYIILGVSPRRYTDAQLKAWKEMNHKGCTIGGKHYTVYEASQLMRQLETSVRRQKDIANLAKLSGDDKLRREAQAKIVNLKAQYKAVSEASGLKQRAERMVMEGYKAPLQSTAKPTAPSPDFMGTPKNFTEESGVIDVKAYRIDDKSAIFSQTYSKDARNTVAFVKDSFEIVPNLKNVPEIVVAKDLPGIAAYDHINKRLYVHEGISNADFVKNKVANGYFVAKNSEEVLRHEMYHKSHWDKVEAEALTAGKNSDIMKQEIEADLRAYVKRQVAMQPSYIRENVSENAAFNYARDTTLNELIADTMLREEKGITVDRELLRLVRECVK